MDKFFFDFSIGYGSLEATLSHASITHQLFGDLVFANDSIVGPNGIAINSFGNPHRVDFTGFFSGSDTGTPQAIGLELWYTHFQPHNWRCNFRHN